MVRSGNERGPAEEAGTGEAGGAGASSLGHLPAGRWEFDGGVTACFDDMLARSVPGLGNLRRATFSLGRRFVRPGADIVDLGCSLGGALAPFLAAFGGLCRCVGVEGSEPMRDACRGRFAGEIAAGRVVIGGQDLRTDYPDVSACLTLCVLTLQFVPAERRPRLLRRVWEKTRPGGALLLVEKVLGEGADMDDALVSCYYEFKEAMGYTAEEVARKRLALEGALVPLTARWNEDALRQAGFTRVECFWRLYNFAAWVAVKGDSGEAEGDR